MKEHTRVVVIGGGIVGAAVLYHLTKLGWSDVVLVERKQLTAGSTWHAAGGFHAINSDPNISRLQAYGISVYKEVEEISGQDTGMHLVGGLQVAASEERWENIRYEHGRHKVLGLDSQLLTPDDIKKIVPIMDTSDVIGGLFDSNEGHIDPYGSTHAMAKAARKGGAEIYLKTKVEDLVHKPDGSWTVVTDQGNIQCEHVVNAGGLWAREVGAMAGVHNRKAAPAGLLGGQLQPGRESLGGRRPFGGRQRIAYLAHSGGHVLAIETGGDRDLAQVGVGNALAAPEVARLLQQQVPQDFFELGVLQSHRQRQPDRGAKDSYQRGLRPFQAVLHGKVKGREARRSSVTAYAASGA